MKAIRSFLPPSPPEFVEFELVVDVVVGLEPPELQPTKSDKMTVRKQPCFSIQALYQFSGCPASHLFRYRAFR